MWPFKRSQAPADPPSERQAHNAAVDGRKRKSWRFPAAVLASVAPNKPTDVFKPPALPKGVLPETAALAMDEGFADIYGYANSSLAVNDLGFLGYAYLATLTQRPEYRRPAEIVAKHMTRKWIKFVSKSKKDQSEKISALKDAFREFNIKAAFNRAAMVDANFGRAQIFIDVAMPDGKPVTEAEKLVPLARIPEKITKGSFRGIRVIEPQWTSPYRYNSTDPTAFDFYKPQSWYVMGTQYDSSRLLTLISKPVPDILKPAYNFGGLSLTQIMKPYVDAFLRTRNSVSDIVHSYSTSGIKTDMGALLQDGQDADLITRMELFNRTKDNRSLMMLDSANSEEFFQFNTPLSGLDALQAQALEMMAFPDGIPLLFLFGTTPSGLNASTDGEVRAFYDWISASQEDLFTDPLSVILEIIQLSKFGEIDPDIGFEFVPLYQLDGEALARVRKSDADAGVGYINAGVLAPMEERKRLADDPESGYHGLVVDDVPEPPQDPAQMPEDDSA